MWEVLVVNINPVESILEIDYDLVVIAIFEPIIASVVRGKLNQMGIDDKKIVWSNPKVQIVKK